ncbi:MAG: hypothetical protein U1C56_02245, partial [Candidatus Curtissbacteria bacterium]|nr:hypothetical protein [Candidatus Curtissbacteria bacterium]
AVSAILELLKLTDDALIREQRGLHSEVARIITSARREIRISHNARATTRRVRFKQMKRLLHNGEEPDPPEEEATSLSHPDTRPFATDSSLDINIHRMRTGTGVPPNQPLEFHRQSGELARIEAQALEALTGRKPGGKKEKPPTNMRHMAVVPPPTDD